MNQESMAWFAQWSQCQQQLWQKWLTSGSGQNKLCMGLGLEWLEFWQQETSEPEQMIGRQLLWWQEQLQLFERLLQQQPAVIAPDKGDRRFKDPQWHSDPWFSCILQSYLLTCRHVQQGIEQQPGLDDRQKSRLQFLARQMLGALSPSNCLATNPELVKLTADSGGRNLLDGLQRLREDLARSGNQLKVTMNDDTAFGLGRDLAITPGRVVFENPLLQLIQYQPSTDQVFKRPVLMVPAFINKFYILDLQPKNSLVNYLVSQGHTVFMISWVNPDQSHSQLDFDDYVVDGVMAALDAIEAATGEREVNGVGYCIGGTLLAATMAYMSARRMKRRIQSASLFTTLLDFSQPGEIGHFLNQATVDAVAAQNRRLGLMDGRQLAVTFSLLRENQLYWNYFVEGYLKGKSPMAFDLLHWNSDSTNVPGPCHTSLVRRLYQHNQLVNKGKFKIRGTALDLKKVTAPAFVVATREDHIALWQPCYDSGQALEGKTTFVLGESGHVAGIINPPGGKYGHLTGESAGSADAWLKAASRQEGSWWPTWQQWLEQQNPATKVAARVPAEGLEAAPGRYVRRRLDGIG
ncbi:class I poly(R)-hydroxyalkanoic acid synthase [Ferrimonas sp.]|uniref:class I poly(R)-hydroxyalkanoic acid synthase n=1 Tax=Ferrimonas sp. TaxID=2080861 RepID=UPI003A8F60F1